VYRSSILLLASIKNKHLETVLIAYTDFSLFLVSFIEPVSISIDFFGRRMLLRHSASR
jgi:hypothetical protein